MNLLAESSRFTVLHMPQARRDSGQQPLITLHCLVAHGRCRSWELPQAEPGRGLHAPSRGRWEAALPPLRTLSPDPTPT